MDTIGTQKPNNAIDIITAYLSDDNVRVRVAAVWNLAEIHNTNVIPYIIKAAKENSSEEVRGVAIAILHQPNRE